jgi:hypothetical protein
MNRIPFVLLLAGILASCAHRTGTSHVTSSPAPFELHSPLEFVGTNVMGPIDPDQIPALMKFKVKTGSDDPENYNFLAADPEHFFDYATPNTNRIRVETCEQYLSARARGAGAMTGFDMLVEESFCQVCDTLRFLQAASPAKQSLLPKDILADLNLLPVSLLPFNDSDQERDLIRDAERGLSLRDYANLRKVRIVRRGPYELELECNGVRVYWQEMARADFNDDGFEDVLLFEYCSYIGGSGHWTSHQLLTRTKDHAGRMLECESIGR